MSRISLNQGEFVTNSSQNQVRFRHISKILLRRRFIVLGVSCIVMSVTSLLAMMTKPTYKSYMQILVSSNVYEGINLNNIPQSTDTKSTDAKPPLVDYYTAQKNLMLSSKLMERTVNILRSNYPNITVGDIKSKSTNGQKLHLEVTQLERKTGVNKFVTPVFEVSFQHNDPVKARKVLLALQKVYQDYNIEQRQERLNKGLAVVNTRLPLLQKQVKQAEINLENFRKKHNLLDPQSQRQVLINSLAETQQQLQTTRTELQNVRDRQQNLEQNIVVSTQQALISSSLNQSIRYQTLFSEVQKTEQLLAQEQLRYTDNSPIIESLKQQRQNQLKLLQQEAKQLTADTQKVAILTQEQLVEELTQLKKIAQGLINNEKSLVASEQRISAELKKYPSLIAESQRLLSEVATHRQALEQMVQTQQFVGLQITQAGFDWQVLEEPTLATYNSYDKLLLVFGGMVVGPVLGVVMALIWGIRHRVIHSAQDLQRVSNLRLLGSVPKLASNAMEKRLPSLAWNWRRNTAPSLVETDSWLPCHETLDMVYQNTQILKYPFPFNSLMVTSALPGEGRTTLALGLAASAAHMHQRVLLIDANLRSPKLHKILQLSNDWGLSLLLVDETSTNVQDYIQPIHPSIDILTAGPVPEDPVKLLSSQRMKELIELFEQSYDLVLIDAPAILGTVDARIVASFCNGIMMVGRIGWVTQTEITQAVEILNRLNLVGIIANEAS
ncbi:exopolysaccharide transport family protein [Anabaena sp. UHCC 0399]|uniref:GumC family protein n=1 Tax=Anabaena sp. UHCC 0399 TaxID=3110238 RepID=UPI002B1EC236|nr:exopolysaccharide transport family protein [Anabaena sp. UHCC 0399]MEA5565284.1 exopolysaccharide transport family protein [Anabaena sp. UHCC 0399]